MLLFNVLTALLLLLITHIPTDYDLHVIALYHEKRSIKPAKGLVMFYLS